MTKVRYLRTNMKNLKQHKHHKRHIQYDTIHIREPPTLLIKMIDFKVIQSNIYLMNG